MQPIQQRGDFIGAGGVFLVLSLLAHPACSQPAGAGSAAAPTPAAPAAPAQEAPAPGLTQPVPGKGGVAAEKTRSYDDFERPQACAGCHRDIFQQWEQSMMAQAFTHEWDEIEYFDLAVPHAAREPKVAAVKAECNGCHTPMAFLAGDVPPPRPAKRSRANEGVSCDVCHVIRGSATARPFNFSYVVEPGKTKVGPRGDRESPHHATMKLDFISTAEYCGTCHNEQSPYGVWVKSTQIEYAEGPYPRMGLKCHDCHMPKAEGKISSTSNGTEVSHQHLFFGAHVDSKIRGAIELRMHADRREVEPGETVKLTLYLFNAKAGHKIPSGSVEDRPLYVHVEARDAKGAVTHLPVDRKGFPGEEYTLASDELAWHDLGEARGIADFPGLPRDGLPIGDRIFRQAYLNPRGALTIMQWYTASLGVDYRIGPLETKVETYTFKVPVNAPPGPLVVQATLNYRLLVKTIGDHLGVPAEETADRLINDTTTTLTVLD